MMSSECTIPSAKLKKQDAENEEEKKEVIRFATEEQLAFESPRSAEAKGQQKV